MKKFLKIAVAAAIGLLIGITASAEGVVRLPEDLKIIEAEAFAGDQSIVEVIVPRGAETIGSEAFADSSLRRINIPDTVAYIAPDAFDGCDIEQIVVSAGSYAAKYCTDKALNCLITTPESVFTITVLENGCCEITDCSSTDADIVIPEYIRGYRVSGIAWHAFYDMPSLKSIVIPESVTTIANHAFEWSWALENVTMHDGITYIGVGAFIHCQSLAQIELPAQLEYLGAASLADTGLTSVTVPDGIDEICAGTFSSCRKLKEIILPEGITAFGEGAFSYTGIEYFVVPETVTILEESLFNGCSSLLAVELHENLTEIRKLAFSNCKSMIYVDIPRSVISIGYMAFFDCTGLQLVGLPGTIQNIDSSAFRGVENAFFVTERNSVALEYCKAKDKMILLEPNAESDFTVKKLTSTTCRITGYKGTAVDVFLPETIGGRTVTEIGYKAFSGNTKIKSVSILNSVSTIGSKAFYGCKNLSYMQITTDVTSISDSAFTGCDNLSHLIVVEFAEVAAASASVQTPVVDSVSMIEIKK